MELRIWDMWTGIWIYVGLDVNTCGFGCLWILVELDVDTYGLNADKCGLLCGIKCEYM